MLFADSGDVYVVSEAGVCGEVEVLVRPNSNFM